MERALLGVCVAAIAVAAPAGLARAARVREAARHWHRAESFVHGGEWQEAELEFRASLGADPTFYPSREAIASYAWTRQDYDTCFREYTEACRVDPRNPAPWLALGQLRVRRREYAAAVPLLERALALNPSDRLARQLLASCRDGRR